MGEEKNAWSAGRSTPAEARRAPYCGLGPL